MCENTLKRLLLETNEVIFSFLLGFGIEGNAEGASRQKASFNRDFR